MADIKIRTREEMLFPDFNYYIHFKISPTEKDVAKIEKTILMERNKWAQGLPIQRRYKELYNDVINVMINNIGFDYETNEYSIKNARELELENAKRLKIGRAVMLLKIMSKRGVLYKSNLEKIVFSEKIQWYSVVELEKEIEPLIDRGVQYIDDTQSVIDFRKYKEAEKNLIMVKKNSLYEVLGCDNKSSITQLADAVTTVYANLKNKTTPEGTATDKLLCIAKIIFNNEETKSKYDDYLKVVNSVFNELELRSCLGIHEINMSEYLDYAQIIKEQLEMNNEQAACYLGAALREYHIAVSTEKI